MYFYTMLKDFISLFFPELCVSCEDSLKKGEKFICLNCLFELPETNYHKNLDNPIARKFYGKVLINRAMAFYRFKKGARLQKIMHKLKYKDAQEVGVFLGRKYGITLNEDGFKNAFDLIIPIPLHKNKLKKRGFNQAAVISRGLSEGLGIPFSDEYLLRVVYTETQTKKNRMERWKNVDSIFQIPDISKIKDKRILIVDDVITTGSTIEACAKILLENGAKEINVACLAVAEN